MHTLSKRVLLSLSILLSLALAGSALSEEPKRTSKKTAETTRPAAKPKAAEPKAAEPKAAEPKAVEPKAAEPKAPPESGPPLEAQKPKAPPESGPALEAGKPESPLEPVLSAEAAKPAVPVSTGKAESRLGLVLAPKAGATIPTSKLGTTFIGSLEVGYDFPFLAPLLGIVVPGISVEFSYLEPGLSGSGTSAVAGDYTYSLSQRLLILSIDAVMTLEFGDFAPYAALGYGFTFFRPQSIRLG